MVGIEKYSKRATQQDIQVIQNVYLQCKNIETTIEKTGWSRNTVHKYVKELSNQHPSSKYNHRHILKLDKNTHDVIEEFIDLSTASKITNISISNISHCLKGDTKTAGGYMWLYKDGENQIDKLVNNYKNLCLKLGRIATIEDIEASESIQPSWGELKNKISISTLKQLAGVRSHNRTNKYGTKDIIKLMCQLYNNYGRRLTESELRKEIKKNKYPSVTTILVKLGVTSSTKAWNRVLDEYV